MNGWFIHRTIFPRNVELFTNKQLNHINFEFQIVGIEILIKHLYYGIRRGWQ